MTGKLLPGRIDGLLLCLVIACLAAIPLPWGGYVELFDSLWWQQATLIVCGAGALAFVALVDLWLLYGKRNLIYRHAISLALTVPVALSLAFGSEWVQQWEPGYTFSEVEDGILASFYIYFGVFRWVSVCVLTLVSVPLQVMTRWRISDGRGDDQTKTRIAHILILIASFAISIGVLRPMFQFFESEESAIELAMIFVIELIVLVVFVLSPTLLCFLFSWFQRHYLKTMFAIGLLLGVPSFSVVAWLFADQAIQPEVIARQYGMYGALFFWIVVQVRFAQAIGFGFVNVYGSASDAPHPAVSVRPTFRWTGIIAAAALLGAAYLFGQLYSPLPLVTCRNCDGAEALAYSRKLQRISRAFGIPKSRCGISYRWAGDIVSSTNRLTYSDDFAEYDFTRFRDIDKALKLLTRNETSASFISIEAADGIRPEVFETLGRLDYIYALNIDADYIAPDAFADFLSSTTVESLDLTCNTSKKHIAALSNGQFNELLIHSEMKVDEEDIARLRRLPVCRMSIQFDQDEPIDLDGFDSLLSLTISESKLSTQLFEGLSGSPDLTLHLEQCEVPSLVWDQLSAMNLGWLYIEFDPDSEVDESALLKLADNRSLSVVQFRSQKAGDLSPLLASRFDLRAGYRFANVQCGDQDIRELLTADGEFMEMSNANPFGGERGDPVSVLTWAVGKYGSLDRALDKVAHSIVRNDMGDIVELDLQWISLSEKEAEQIARLPELKRLRYSFWGRSLEVDLTLFKSRSIESLEIPNSTVTSQVVSDLAAMTQLRRLQLPMTHIEECACELAHPEQIPISSECCNIPWAELAVLRIEAEADEYPRLSLGRSEFNQLRTLEQLEYLFMPGHLLDQATIKTIESFTHLRELHAPFADCDARLLSRLSKLTKLRSLTVGIGPDLPQDKLKLAAQFVEASQHLKTLQLFICDQALYESQEMQEAWRGELQGLMAKDAELHLIVIPE